jgi:transposase
MPPVYRKRSLRRLGPHRATVSFNRIKQWRDLATRYAERASICQASLLIIVAIIRLK